MGNQDLFCRPVSLDLGHCCAPHRLPVPMACSTGAQTEYETYYCPLQQHKDHIVDKQLCQKYLLRHGTRWSLRRAAQPGSLCDCTVHQVSQQKICITVNSDNHKGVSTLCTFCGGEEQGVETPGFTPPRTDGCAGGVAVYKIKINKRIKVTSACQYVL